jgi:hypothetical protein
MHQLASTLVLSLAFLLPVGSRGDEISSKGQQLVKALDQMDVEHLWQAKNYLVPKTGWETGEASDRPVTDGKAHTHCSAFVAAACKRLGVYILRPPDHSEILLANAQYDWLHKEGKQHGWTPVRSAVEAQKLANQGYLVVASFKEKNPKRSGHIAIVRPSNRSEAKIREYGPQIIQAGMTNYKSTSLREGFKHHPSAWGDKQVRYFAHEVVDEKSPQHLVDARSLVKQLALTNTGYKQGKGFPEIVWDGEVRAFCDCSALIDNLLMHSYGYSKAELKKWFGAEQPTAKQYHDLIADPKGKGFVRITHLKDAQPGDLLAVKYAEEKPNHTGHVMLVDGLPTEMKPALPEVKGAVKQWQVPIIDSAKSGHGKTDTRYEAGASQSGVGKGILRVYTDALGKVVAYTWSPESTSQEAYTQKNNHMVIGRLVLDYKP